MMNEAPLDLVREFANYIPTIQTPISIALIWFLWRIKTNCLPTLRKEMGAGFKDVGEKIARLEGRVDEHHRTFDKHK